MYMHTNYIEENKLCYVIENSIIFEPIMDFSL